MICRPAPAAGGRDPRAAQAAFVRVFEAVTQSEDLYLLPVRTNCPPHGRPPPTCRASSCCVSTANDAWARDVGPTFVRHPQKGLCGISWSFNAWGGTVDGLYADWRKDDALAAAFCRAVGLPCASAAPFVLEGGSIHSDGEGTLLVTESCLLSTPGATRSCPAREIEETLCAWLGAQKVLWAAARHL